MKATVLMATLGCLIFHVASAEDGTDEGVKFEFGATLNVVLSDTVDARKSKPGDIIKGRAAEDLKTAGTVVIPRGTKLFGHITEARTAGQERDKSPGAEEGQLDSRAALGITFDRAELKGGREIPLHTTIFALAAPEGALSSDKDSSSGGGFGGGFGGGGSPGAMVSSGAHAASDDMNALGGRTRNTSEVLAPSPGAIGGLNTNGTLYASSRGVFGIEDLSLKPDAVPSGGSSLILSAGRSVHLASGTRMLLSVGAGSAPGQPARS